MAEIKFNEKIKRLEEIVSILEKGDAPLEEALALFEEGSRLTKECNLVLENATLKLKEFEMKKGESNE